MTKSLSRFQNIQEDVCETFLQQEIEHSLWLFWYTNWIVWKPCPALHHSNPLIPSLVPPEVQNRFKDAANLMLSFFISNSFSLIAGTLRSSNQGLFFPPSICKAKMWWWWSSCCVCPEALHLSEWRLLGPPYGWRLLLSGLCKVLYQMDLCKFH